ncbi:hypothetical protein Bca4012_034459 [Brassica carinata]|uniref:Cytochrome P450 n=2 Tax=Brassica TaxID=3705 RepID=A0A3P6D6E1_BRAOL|nr:unnamed protein product [Brassica napus]CDY14859.1 BnaC04g48560D [Brassica napus]VDD16112.1 unnamed protein product [Brassica oleracea]
MLEVFERVLEGVFGLPVEFPCSRNTNNISYGLKILSTTYIIHYNPEIFQDPTSFTIQAYTYLSFGRGPRLCAGHQLAKASTCSLAFRCDMFYNWSFVYPDETVSMVPLPFLSLGMPIKISPKGS